MKCEANIDTMTDYLLSRVSGDDSAAPDRELVRHCASCPECREKMDILLRIVTGRNFRLSRPPRCREVLERMAELVECGEDGMPGTYPAEWLHLQVCDRCREVFDLTASCMTEEYATAFDRVRQTMAEPETAAGTVWEDIGRTARRLIRPLHILLGRGKETLELVPDWLATASLVPAPAQAHRSAAAGTTNSYELAIPCPQENRNIVITIMEEPGGNVTIRGQLLDRDEKRAIGGVVIALLDGQGRFLTQLVTPESSPDKAWVEFREIDAGEYIIRIREEDRSWEVPLRLA